MEVQFILLAIYINPFHFCGLEKKIRVPQVRLKREKNVKK